MSQNKVILKLKDPVLFSDGKPIKDASGEKRSKETLQKLTPVQIASGLPDFTVGQALIGLMNAKESPSVDQLSKYSRLTTKIRDKIELDKGEWSVEQKDLLDLQEIFKEADPKHFNVNTHGQIYNKIQDLLIKSTA